MKIRFNKTKRQNYTKLERAAGDRYIPEWLILANGVECGVIKLFNDEYKVWMRYKRQPSKELPSPWEWKTWKPCQTLDYCKRQVELHLPNQIGEGLIYLEAV